MSLAIHHVALRTHDLPRLERFYVSALGLAVVGGDDTRGTVWLGLKGPVLMLETATPGEPPIDPNTRELLAFDAGTAADKERWRARLHDAGVVVEAETAHTLYFRDPDGRRVAVSAYPLPAP